MDIKQHSYPTKALDRIISLLTTTLIALGANLGILLFRK